MRYIRTKNGRIIDSTKIVTGSKYMDFITNDKSFKEIFQTEPLDKADTIEELCDRFIAETEGNIKFWVVSTLENAKMYCGIKNIYGAIWTDKGLIFVAKMNDREEFELI